MFVKVRIIIIFCPVLLQFDFIFASVFIFLQCLHNVRNQYVLALLGPHPHIGVQPKANPHSPFNRAVPPVHNVRRNSPSAKKISKQSESIRQWATPLREGGLQAGMQNWEREYLMMFGDHVVAVGFVISFSPFQFEILLSFLYFVCRCGYEIVLHKFGKSIKPLKTLQRVINLGLLICAIVGLSRTRWDPDLRLCRDRDYRPPMLAL